MNNKRTNEQTNKQTNKRTNTQFGNSAAYNITGGALSPCGNATTGPTRCAGSWLTPGEGQAHPYRVMQREQWDVSSIP